MLDHHAKQEETELELGSRDHERRYGSSRREIRDLDRQVIVLGHVIANDELIVGVDVHEASGSRIDGVRVIDARQFFPARESSVPEPQIAQDRFEPTCVRAMNEEVQIVLSTRRPIEGLVALPVAVADPRFLEGAAEGRDELERCAVRIDLAQGRAVPTGDGPIDARDVTRMHGAISSWTEIGRGRTTRSGRHRWTRWHPVAFPLTCMLHGVGVCAWRLCGLTARSTGTMT